MDLQMEVMDGVEATREIRSRYDDVEVVVLTSFIEEERVHAALEAGASGYLLKDADVDELCAAIRAAHGGEVHLDAAVAKRLMSSLRAPKQADPFADLTDREREILRMVAAGKANKEIAAELVISERRTHARQQHPAQARPGVEDSGGPVGCPGRPRRRQRRLSSASRTNDVGQPATHVRADRVPRPSRCRGTREHSHQALLLSGIRRKRHL